MAVKELSMAFSLNALIEQVRIQYLNCSPPTEQLNAKRCFVAADRWTALVRWARAYTIAPAMAQITQIIFFFFHLAVLFVWVHAEKKTNRKTKWNEWFGWHFVWLFLVKFYSLFFSITDNVQFPFLVMKSHQASKIWKWKTKKKKNDPETPASASFASVFIFFTSFFCKIKCVWYEQ